MLIRFLAIAAFVCALSSGAAARQINPSLPDASGNVTWGPGPTKDPVDDTLPAASPSGGGSKVKFTWTSGLAPHPDYGTYIEDNSTSTPRDRHFKRPIPAAGRPAITDWLQEIGYTNGVGGHHNSSVHAGVIESGPRSWTFAPLDLVDGIFGRIPDFGPSVANTEPGDLTIFAAVNLELYLQSNPVGFSNGNWGIGQTLNSTGLQIVNGQIAGLQGMYFASVPFTFDANSATGWVPSDGTSWLNSGDWQAVHGDMVIIGGHTVPAPGSIVCLVPLGALASRRRRGIV